MEKLNRNNADIKKILNKKVAVVCDSKEKELDFRKWVKQYINAVDEDYVYTNCGNGICINLEYDRLIWEWDYTNYFLEDNYSVYEWEIAEEQKTYTIKDVVENEGKVYKCITDSNSGVLYKYIDDVLYATYNRIEWRKSLVKLRKLLKYEFIECKPEPKKITFEEAFKEIAEEEKTYTIKDVVENEGKIYRSITNNCIYKYDKTNLYYKAIRKLSDDWKKTELTLGEILEIELVEYKPEPKKITFEEAFKEMETKVCRCLFSNRCITINGSHFIDVNNVGYTSLSVSEIKSEWVAIDE